MPSVDIFEQKHQLRQQMRHILRQLTPSQRHEASAAICHSLQKTLTDIPAVIASFIPLSTEPDLTSLHQLLPNTRIVYPRSQSVGTMHFHHLSDLTTLKKGLYDIPQPPDSSETRIAPTEIDLFLCPAFAYNKEGARLGKGGGYYDRLLAQRSPHSKLLGICFKPQLLANLPTEPHDIEVDQIISA